jgi:hypothetical protein
VSNFWPVAKLASKFVGTIGSVAGTAALAGQEANIWQLPTRASLGSVGFIAAVAVVTSSRSLWWEYKGPRDAQLQEDVGEILRRTARQVAECCRDVDRADVGVTVLVVRPRRLFGQHLLVLRRERENAFPPPSGITWTKGKGLVGRCWAESRVVVEDLRDIASQHKDCAQSQFEALPGNQKMGLTYEEFRTIIGKYSSVLVTPIMAGGEVVGCLSIDLPMGVGSRRVLDKLPIKQIAAFAAASAGKILRPTS